MGQGPLLFAAALLAFLSPAAAQSVDLQEAVLAGDVGAVRSFIAGGADLDEQGDLGTPLHVAALSCSTEVRRWTPRKFQARRRCCS